MLRKLRWVWAKRVFASPRLKHPWGPVRSSVYTHEAKVEDLPPDSKGYERLAAYWDDFAWFVPDYGRFLPSVASYYRQPIRNVLDLACGTGRLTRQVGRWARTVVGLDASETMLHEARSRSKVTNIRYEQGDFRRFTLSESFDAVICGSDSLNYLETPVELTDVFRCVCNHLGPGGLFLFDALNDAAFRVMADKVTLVAVGKIMFTNYYFYDPISRVSESRTVFHDCIERHRRIPIEQEDVEQAAAETGFAVAERIYSRAEGSMRTFYLLRKPLSSRS